MVAEISARLGPSRGSLIVRTRMFPRVPSSLCHGDNSRLRARGETQGKLLFPVFTWQWEALMFFFFLIGPSPIRVPSSPIVPGGRNCGYKSELQKKLFFFFAVASTGNSHFCNTLPSFVRKNKTIIPAFVL